MRYRRRAGALGAAAGYGLAASVFTTFPLARLMDLRAVGRIECAAGTVVLLTAAAAVAQVVRGRAAARRR